MDAIVAQNITVRYGALTAVDGVSLRVPEGTVFGLLGPNGAGKTTVIKVLTALRPADGGSASVAGFDVATHPLDVKRRLGWVAAEVILDDDYSAWENLWLQAKLHSLRGWEARARDLLRSFELADRAKDPVKMFSTGMRKKLEIALALLSQPTVIFMDEPTIGLDVGTRRMVWGLIGRLHREFHVTVFLTTHYIEEADHLCDQIAIIDQGKVVATGSPGELRGRVGTDLIEIELLQPLEASVLAGAPGVVDARVEGDTLRVKVANAAASLSTVLGRLPAGVAGRTDIEHPSLETAFLELTGYKMGEAEERFDARRFYLQLKKARR